MWHNQFPYDRKFKDVFLKDVGEDAFPDSSLHEVITMAEGGDDVDMNPATTCTGSLPGNYYNMLRQLGFHSVAALQNAATDVSFDLTVDDVITIFVDAYTKCDVLGAYTSYYMEDAKDDLDTLNNQGCPF